MGSCISKHVLNDPQRKVEKPATIYIDRDPERAAITEAKEAALTVKPSQYMDVPPTQTVCPVNKRPITTTNTNAFPSSTQSGGNTTSANMTNSSIVANQALLYPYFDNHDRKTNDDNGIGNSGTSDHNTGGGGTDSHTGGGGGMSSGGASAAHHTGGGGTHHSTGGGHHSTGGGMSSSGGRCSDMGGSSMSSSF